MIQATVLLFQIYFKALPDLTDAPDVERRFRRGHIELSPQIADMAADGIILATKGVLAHTFFQREVYHSQISLHTPILAFLLDTVEFLI